MKIKKVLLIEPKAPGDHVYRTVNMPRLGLPLLGTILRGMGYSIRILMGDGDSISPHEVLDADLVGISTTTSTSAEAYRIARFVQSRNIPVVIGGIHATFMPEEAMIYADYVIRGEAESSFPALIKALEKDLLPYGIPGVSFRECGEVIHNPGNSCWQDVDSLPVPDLSLMNLYNEISTYPVMTSRGCPFDCNFCSVTPMFGKKFRYRSTGLVLKELENYKEKKVFFVDDNFTAGKRRSKELLRNMIDMNILPLSWGAQVRVDVARDHELLELMRRSNGKTAYIGMESINPDTLKSYNKKQDIGEIKEAVRCLHDQKISVHGMFMFGGEADTAQTLRDTVEFALDTRIDTVQFLALTPLPGTPLFEKLDSEGRLLTREWEFYDGQHVVYRPLNISPQKLQEEMVSAYRKFYSFKNFFRNIKVTGWSTTLFRGVGWWLIRHWEKENRGYNHILERFLKPDAGLPVLGRKIKGFSKAGMLSPLKNSYLQLYLTMRKDVIYLRVKGVVNRATMDALRRELNSMVPHRSFELVINTEGLHFASEKAARRFSLLLNNMGRRARRLEVFCRVEDGLQHIVEKYIPSLPRFGMNLF